MIAEEHVQGVLFPVSPRLNSPFRYPGGKYYARRMILDVLPAHEDYCEPFAGGASIFFAKYLSDGRSILNDLDADVINTLVHIRDDVEGLVSLLEGVEATRENHAYYKSCYTVGSDLERAFRWYYLNRTSYSGIMRDENCFWGYGPAYSIPPDRWPESLRRASQKLQGVELLSMDFEDVIDGLPDGCFMFVDPPYYEADQHKFYTCTFDFDDHRRLEECLRRNNDRIHFLLTYDDCPDVRDMYGWTSFVSEREWIYTLSRTDNQMDRIQLKDGYKGSRRTGRELFIGNYENLRVLQGHRISNNALIPQVS